MPDYASMLSAAVSAVASACRVTRAVQGKMAALSAMTKDDRSPVTIADFASQAVIASMLRERLPGALRLVAEESSASLQKPENETHLRATLEATRNEWPDATERDLLEAIDLGTSDPDHAAFWTLDPIDGTKGFVRGQQYAVSLAYIERGEPVLGVLGCPNLAADFSEPLSRPDRHGTLYSCLRGQGVWEVACDKAEGKASRIARAVHDMGEDGVQMCASVDESHTHMGRVEAIMDWLEEHGKACAEPLRLDSQAKYAVVARGQADVYLRLPTKKDYVEYIWDHAAGALIASEAGVAVTDIEGKQLDFAQGRRLSKNRGIVAAPAWIHGQVLEAIRGVGV
jgi:3'(2'), 5'-bisphosphate nucleotidase